MRPTRYGWYDLEVFHGEWGRGGVGGSMGTF